MAKPKPATRPDPRARAAAFRTSNACEADARSHLNRGRSERALEALDACSARSDFDLLEPLLFGSWPDLLRSNKRAGLRILARSVARRGNFEADIKSLRAARLGLGTLPEPAPGQWVLFVAVVAESGPSSLTMAEIGPEKQRFATRARSRRRRQLYVQVDRAGRIRSISARTFNEGAAQLPFEETGVRFRVRSSPRCQAPVGQPLLVLARVDRPEGVWTPEECMAIGVRSPEEPSP